MNPFLASYIETALWSSHDESTPSGGEPLDRNYSASDLAPETLARMTVDCEQFQTKAEPLASDFPCSRVAHDFWLTRNRHGAGFWDGDYPKAIGDALTKLAHSFGECDLYVGDDGKLYLS